MRGWRYWLIVAGVWASAGGVAAVRVMSERDTAPLPVHLEVDLGAVEAELALIRDRLLTISESVTSDTSVVYLQVVKGDTGIVIKVIDPDHRIRLVK